MRALPVLVVLLVAAPGAGALTLADAQTWLAAHPEVRDWLAARGPVVEPPPAYDAAAWSSTPLGDGSATLHRGGATAELRLAVLADDAWRAQPGWEAAVRDAVTPALDLLDREAGVRLDRFVLGTTPGVVATACDLERAAAAWAGRADAVLVLSAGEIDARWGMALTSPACGAASFVPAAYAALDPLPTAPRRSLQHLAAHELAHLVGMEHGDAACWDDGARVHKTLEAFTAAPDAPLACGSHLALRATYHYTLSWTTRSRAQAG